jgi:3-oxoacyl-[acyl-carrier protein] reductase
MNLELSGKRALIGGGSQGIGKAVAIELASLGVEVCLMARNEEKLTAAIAQLPCTSSQKHRYLIVDNNFPEKLSQQVKDEINNFGGFEILINNTGGPPAGKAFEADIASFILAFNQHLVCNQLLVQVCLPTMRAQQFGRIINIISTSVKQPLPGLGVSNTIRGAVANWSKTLAMELANLGITVNNVLPGATATQRLTGIIENKASKSGNSIEEIIEEMLHEIPAKRFGKPEEIAAAVAFLASPAAAYINGINLPVDGGRTLSL